MKMIYSRNSEAVSVRKVTATERVREASVEGAQAALTSAKLNLAFTQVRAPVDGYITNLSLQIGDQVASDKPAVALVDSNSYWGMGFLKRRRIYRSAHSLQEYAAPFTL